MRRLLILLLVIAFAIIAVAFVVPALIPDDALRSRVERAASEALGREVTLPGDIALRLLPHAEVRAGQARIANAEGFGDDAFAEMAEMRVSVAIMPLISRIIEVQEFVLVDPTIRLQARGSRNNWSFGNAAAPSGAQASSGGFVRQPGALPFEASFGDVRVINGSVSYSDGSQVRRIDALDLRMELPSVDAPVRLSGSFNADGRPMAFDVSLASLRGFFEGAQTPFQAELTGALADISFDGSFRESPDLAFDGAASIALPLRALARYLGADLPEGDIFQRFTAEAQIRGVPGLIELSQARVTFDAMQASGALALNYDRSPRPQITGTLTTPRLDLTPYIPAEDEAPASGAGGGVGPWSRDEMDLAPLSTVDADLTIRADAFKARDLEATDVTVDVDLQNGRMVAGLRDFQMYGGRGVITAVVNSRSANPSFSLNAEIETLQALPFLTAAAGFDRLAGIGALSLDLSASGASPAAIMESLSGQGGFAFTEGAITGVNLAQVIRTVQQGIQSGSIPAGFSESQQTDFSALTGTINIERGLARNLDLSMLSPLLRVEGSGSVNLAEQMIEYRLTPRAVQTLTGQGGDLDLQGVGVPVILRGGFNDVSVTIDFASVARDIARARAATLIGGQAGAALSGGGTLQDAARGAVLDALTRNAPENAEEEDPGRRLLRGLLGGSRPQPSPDEDADAGDDEPAADDDEGEPGR
jgi:AsmA protein